MNTVFVTIVTRRVAHVEHVSSLPHNFSQEYHYRCPKCYIQTLLNNQQCEIIKVFRQFYRIVIMAFLLSVCWKHWQIVDCQIRVHPYYHRHWSVILIDCVLTSTPLYIRFVITYFFRGPPWVENSFFLFSVVCAVPVDQSLIVCLVFLSFCSRPFGHHCIVSRSSNYGLWLAIKYLQTFGILVISIA